MSKKISVIAIIIIIVISLAISIYIPNREKIEEIEDISINYSIIEENGKFGVAQNGNTIIETEYDEIIIPNSHRDVFWCRNNDYEKFINKKNEEIFKEYDNINLIEIHDSIYEKDILTYEKNEMYGLLGITGKTITNAKYEEIFNLGYKNGEVVIKENGKYGIIDQNGNIKIKSEYDLIQADGYYTEEKGYTISGYIVQKITNEGYRYGYYDSDGSKVLNEEYNQLSRITQIKSNDIYLMAAKNGQYGVFINNSKIINTQYQEIDYNSDLEIFIVERTGKFGAINLKGVQILKPEYTELQINGIYIYTVKDEERKVWDTTGNEVNIPFEAVIQKTNSEYFIRSESGNYSILNSKFEPISNKTYKYLEFCYDNYFIATNEQDKVGIIDIQENIVVDFKYDVIQVIKGNKAIQAIEFATNNTAFYDKTFSLSTELTEASIEYLDKGFRIYNNEQQILFDNEGKIITK